MKPYSIDIRQKILEVYQKEEISIRQLAQRFRVAKSFIQKLIKQDRETGDIRPRPQGGSPPPKLKKEHLEILEEIIEANSDATLDELGDLLARQTGIKISRTTLHRISKKLKYSVKKNATSCREGVGTGSEETGKVLGGDSRG